MFACASTVPVHHSRILMLCYVRSYNLQVVALGRMPGDCGGGGFDNFTPLNEGNSHEKEDG